MVIEIIDKIKDSMSRHTGFDDVEIGKIINAALAAEREKLELIRQEAREKHAQLLAAQAAIAEARCALDYGDDATAKVTLNNVDLSVLDKHDAEVQNPLVDALIALRDGPQRLTPWALKVIDAAIADAKTDRASD